MAQLAVGNECTPEETDKIRIAGAVRDGSRGIPNAYARAIMAESCR